MRKLSEIEDDIVAAAVKMERGEIADFPDSLGEEVVSHFFNRVMEEGDAEFDFDAATKAVEALLDQYKERVEARVDAILEAANNA